MKLRALISAVLVALLLAFAGCGGDDGGDGGSGEEPAGIDSAAVVACLEGAGFDTIGPVEDEAELGSGRLFPTEEIAVDPNDGTLMSIDIFTSEEIAAAYVEDPDPDGEGVTEAEQIRNAALGYTQGQGSASEETIRGCVEA